MVVPRVWRRHGRVRLPRVRRACGLGRMPWHPKAQVFQDTANDRLILYQRDHAHGALTFRALQGIDFVDPVYQAHPRGPRPSRRLDLALHLLRFLFLGGTLFRARPPGPHPVGIPADVAHQVFEPVGDVAAQKLQPFLPLNALRQPTPGVLRAAELT